MTEKVKPIRTIHGFKIKPVPLNLKGPQQRKKLIQKLYQNKNTKQNNKIIENQPQKRKINQSMILNRSQDQKQVQQIKKPIQNQDQKKVQQKKKIITNQSCKRCEFKKKRISKKLQKNDQSKEKIIINSAQFRNEKIKKEKKQKSIKSQKQKKKKNKKIYTIEDYKSQEKMNKTRIKTLIQNISINSASVHGNDKQISFFTQSDQSSNQSTKIQKLKIKIKFDQKYVNFCRQKCIKEEDNHQRQLINYQNLKTQFDQTLQRHKRQIQRLKYRIEIGQKNIKEYPKYKQMLQRSFKRQEKQLNDKKTKLKQRILKKMGNIY